MRLTLRTLLAYLDDILEPADAEELAAKIRESDFASQLVHRIRSCMGRLRVGSPHVLGKGLGADANTVAEYLDNTLVPERVPDFEKVCLESDMHLTEVASCHQILTLVLGEPAQVEPELRSRIYQLGPPAAAEQLAGDSAQRLHYRIDEAVMAPSGADATLAQVAPDSTTTAQASVRASGRRTLLPWIAMLGIGFVLTIAALYGLQILNLTTGGRRIASHPGEGGEHRPAEEPRGGEPADNITSGGPSQRGSHVPTVAPEAGGDHLRPAPEEGTVLDGASAQPKAEEAAAAVPPQPQPDAEAHRPPTPVEGDFPIEDRSAGPEGASGHGEAVAGDSSSPPSGDQKEHVERGPAAPDVAPAPEEEEVDLGRYIADGEVLAVWDEGAATWRRLPARARLAVGQRLRVPTAFRPKLLLASKIQVTLNDRCELKWVDADARGVPAIQLEYGQAVFSNLGEAVSHVVFRLGNERVTITFGDGQSEFAIEVQRELPAGVDPSADVRRMTARVWATSGRVGVQRGDELAHAVEAGQLCHLIAGEAITIEDAEALPSWVSERVIRDIDRSAQLVLEPLLEQGADGSRTAGPERDAPEQDPPSRLTLDLAEAAEHRRVDIRSLAARCLASLDRFEPLVESLSDHRQHPSWRLHFEELQAGLARDRASAAQVLSALRSTAGPQAERLYRMLWGYSPEQLQDGAAAELVAALEDEALEVRVLAIENLKRITGVSGLYRPEQSVAKRQSSIEKWKRRLQAGQIVYRDWPPRPLLATRQ